MTPSLGSLIPPFPDIRSELPRAQLYDIIMHMEHLLMEI